MRTENSVKEGDGCDDPRAEYRWAMMTPVELDEAIRRLPLAIVPSGLLEWHGPHMSTGSDYLRGDAICLNIAKRLGGGVVLPCTWLGAPGFCNWRGTVCFTPTLVKSFALELFRELEKCGFKRIFVFLSHAGLMQEEAWEGAGKQYRKSGHAEIMIKSRPGSLPVNTLGGGHAGPDEAAQLYAAEPRAVHVERYDPEDTLLPKYEGCNPVFYSRGLSRNAAKEVENFMALEHYQWFEGLAEKVTPENAKSLSDETCDMLAEEIKEWIGGRS